MSNLVDHAKRELIAAGMDPSGPDDDPNTWIAQGTMDLIKMFSEQGHSGFSSSYAIQLFSTLAAFEPFGPIRGTDDEWVHVAHHEDSALYQNNRCSHVFKGRKDGRAYDIEGIVFRDPDGGTCTNRESHVFVDFPYTPKRIYVDRDADGNYTLPDDAPTQSCPRGRG